MKYPGAPTRHPAFRRGLNLGRTVLLVTGFVFLATCDEDRTGPEERRTYHITAGACGDVVFVESLGSDSASAFHTIEMRKAGVYGEGETTIEAYALEVVDENGNVPEPDFYALRVLEAGSGMLMHSVSEVITTEGALFNLRWCPD